jgi:hypothetical protein
MANSIFEDPFHEVFKLILKFACTALFVLFLMILILFAGCRPIKDMSIPDEPTIWIVTETYQDKRLKNGLIGYLITPVNSGSINVKPVWIIDYDGKYYVGQRLEFNSLDTYAPGPQK